VPAQKPWKQKILSATLAETDTKSFVAKAIAAAMDRGRFPKKAKQAKEPEKMEMDFQAGQW